jgi:hypothetical protein
MKRGFKVLLGLCLLAAVVFGGIEVIQRYEGDGRSPFEKLEAELEDDRAKGKDTFPLTTPASRKHFIARYCLYMARSERQLLHCSRRPARDVYRSHGNEYAWLFADEAIDYCDRRGSAGRFCKTADHRDPVDRVARLIER